MNEEQFQQEDWDAHYRNQHHPWDCGDASPALKKWLSQGIPKGNRVLIPGCGRGHEVIELARRGFDVTALDISATALSGLSSRLEMQGLNATLIEGDFLKWQPEQAFDVVYEQTSLCTLPPEYWPQYMQQMHE